MDPDFSDQVNSRVERLHLYKQHLLTLLVRQYTDSIASLPAQVRDMPVSQLLAGPTTKKTKKQSTKKRWTAMLSKDLPQTPCRSATRGETLYSCNGSPVSTSADSNHNEWRDSMNIPTTGKRRITLRKASLRSSTRNSIDTSSVANYERLDAARPAPYMPSFVVPIGDMIVDLDPTVSAREIVEALGGQEAKELQESLIRFRQQTDALLAQFGV